MFILRILSFVCTDKEQIGLLLLTVSRITLKCVHWLSIFIVRIRMIKYYVGFHTVLVQIYFNMLSLEVQIMRVPIRYQKVRIGLHENENNIKNWAWPHLQSNVCSTRIGFRSVFPNAHSAIQGKPSTDICVMSIEELCQKIFCCSFTNAVEWHTSKHQYFLTP